MSPRPLILATLVGASVGVPYYASHSPNGLKGLTGAPRSTGVGMPPGISTGQLTTGPGAANLTLPTLGTTIAPSGAPIDGAQFTSINQIIRFDVSKEWVYQNWSRKSTSPTDVGLYSIRVPLVMAPRMNALAGSLTYYFNTQGQVEHIAFRGRTGDTTQLVQLLTTTYGLRPVGGLTGEHVYQSQYNGQVQSELRTRSEAVMWSNSPNQSIAVELELARPGSERVLPPRPTGFESLQAATPAAQQPPAQDTSRSATDSKSGSSYFDKIRHATPQEESPLLRNRWPR